MVVAVVVPIVVAAPGGVVGLWVPSRCPPQGSPTLSMASSKINNKLNNFLPNERDQSSCLALLEHDTVQLPAWHPSCLPGWLHPAATLAFSVWPSGRVWHACPTMATRHLWEAPRRSVHCSAVSAAVAQTTASCGNTLTSFNFDIRTSISYSIPLYLYSYIDFRDKNFYTR